MVLPRSVSFLNSYNIIILGLRRSIMIQFTRKHRCWLANCFEMFYLIERMNVYHWKQIENWVHKLYGYDIRLTTSYFLDQNPPTCLLGEFKPPQIVSSVRRIFRFTLQRRTWLYDELCVDFSCDVCEYPTSASAQAARVVNGKPNASQKNLLAYIGSPSPEVASWVN